MLNIIKAVKTLNRNVFVKIKNILKNIKRLMIGLKDKII